jgi:curved DNA-binding protein
LYLTILPWRRSANEILPHSFFRFEGDNLVCDVPIRPDEAVLGAEISVPTPDGSVKVKVPKGIKSGQSLRLRGKGWTLPKGGRGDLFAKLQIVTPQELSPIEQECYEKIQANSSFNPRAQLEEIKL